jgi:GMP synthase (glutamine-hydrolysing)
MLIGILQCGHAPDEVRAQHGDFDAMFATLFQSYDFTFQTLERGGWGISRHH